MLREFGKAIAGRGLKGALTALALAIVPAGTAVAQDTLPLRLQTVGANASTFPDLYARSFGLYEKHGLDVEYLAPIFNAAGALQMVIQGDADVSYSGTSGAMLAAQQGRDVQAFGVVLEGLVIPVSLTPSGVEKLDAAGVTEDSSFEEKIEALRGMTIATAATGSTVHGLLRYSLMKYGINPETDVTIQPISNLQATFAILRQNAVDGVVGTASSTVAPAEAEGLTKRLLSFDDNDELLRSYPVYGLMASSSYIEENPEAIRRLLAVFAEAKAAIRRGITDEELAKVHTDHFPDMAISTLEAGLENSFPLLQGKMEPRQVNFDALVETANATAESPFTITYEELMAPQIAAEVDAKMAKGN